MFLTRRIPPKIIDGSGIPGLDTERLLVGAATLLCMSWLEVPADDDLYTGDVCNQALGLLTRHVQEASGGQMFVHPDHREWWGRHVEERRAEA